MILKWQDLLYYFMIYDLFLWILYLQKVLTFSTILIHNFHSLGSSKFPQAISTLQDLLLSLDQGNHFKSWLIKPSFPWFLCCFAKLLPTHLTIFSIFAAEVPYKMVYKCYWLNLKPMI